MQKIYFSINSNKKHILKEPSTKNYFIFYFKKYFNILRHSDCWTTRPPWENFWSVCHNLQDVMAFIKQRMKLIVHTLIDIGYMKKRMEFFYVLISIYCEKKVRGRRSSGVAIFKSPGSSRTLSLTHIHVVSPHLFICEY